MCVHVLANHIWLDGTWQRLLLYFFFQLSKIQILQLQVYLSFSFYAPISTNNKQKGSYLPH